MINSPLERYNACIPSPSLQKRGARMLLEQIQVVEILHNIVLVGMIDTGETLVRELAKLLHVDSFVLPVRQLAFDDGHRTIFGAISGIDDVVSYDAELCWANGYSPAVLAAHIQRARYNLMTESRGKRECVHWINSRHTIPRDSTILLVDGSIVAKSKLQVAVDVLSTCGFSKIVPVTLFLDKAALTHNTLPLQRGIFLCQSSCHEQLQREVEQAEVLHCSHGETFWSPKKVSI